MYGTTLLLLYNAQRGAEEPNIINMWFILRIGLWVMLYVAAWESAKKRKIGLTIMSFITLFLTPLISCLVSYFTKKIDISKDYPTYEQRLPYENTTAMIIAAILYLVFGLFFFVAMIGISNSNTDINTTNMLLNLAIFSIADIWWGCTLLSERKTLLLVKNEIQTHENDDRTSVVSANNNTVFTTLFVFDSNRQEKIEVDNNNYSRIADCLRRVVVEHNNEGQYRVSVINVENDKLVLRPIIMHKLTYSGIDECDSMVSDDDQGEYKLNVFYKNGQVDKCVICRKSNNMMFHYCKE